ncbi:MAG: rhomboid family intramembrane serine protease [Acidobacteria bacterium]|nr:rhomboid family intramembrane serine protease [Acidobacteriota bacterium]
MIPEDQFEFLHEVWTRRTPFTFIFLGINVAVFALMALAGGSMNEPTLLAFGVKSNPEIAAGQWWRFITPVFIHIGLLHLLFNSYALWMVGPQVEKLYGSTRFVILYLLTGVAGVTGSYFYHPDTVSAGASGAIFGLFGILLTFGIRYRRSIPPFFKQAVGAGVLPVIVINLIIGFTIPQIDNSAHISGLLAGAALAALLPFLRSGGEDNPILKGLQVSLLALIAISFYQVAAHYDGPRLSARNLSRGFTEIISSGSPTQDFIDAINNAQTAFEASAGDLEAGRTGGLAQMKTAAAKSIDELGKVPSLASKSDELASELREVMQDQYGLIEEIERSGTITFAHGRRLKDNANRYEKVMAEFSRWVASEGRRYGIRSGKDR